jgi:hypothetical protein
MGAIAGSDLICYPLPLEGEGFYGQEWVDELGRHHRIDGPAIAHFYPDGSLKREVYYHHGQRHRADGAAVIVYDENGSPVRRNYWLWGHEISSLELASTQKQVMEDLRPVVF